MTLTNYFPFLPAVEAVFDFALQLTGSMGNVRAELERHPLPGLATAFKPAVPGRGLLSLVELSVKTLGHSRKGQEQQQQQPVQIPAPVPVLAEDQVQMSPQTSVNKVRPLLVNTHSSSMDSGFDDDETNSRSSSPCYSRQLSKTNSDCSLPYTSEQKSRAILSKWKSLTRSQTEPELKHQTLSITGRRTSLRQLLMEAVLILEEAEVKETALNNQSDE